MIKVCRRIGVFKQALCEVLTPLVSDCIMEMDTVAHWGTFPPPKIVNQKALKPLLKQYELDVLTRNQ